MKIPQANFDFFNKVFCLILTAHLYTNTPMHITFIKCILFDWIFKITSAYILFHFCFEFAFQYLEILQVFGIQSLSDLSSKPLEFSFHHLS